MSLVQVGDLGLSWNMVTGAVRPAFQLRHQLLGLCDYGQVASLGKKKKRKRCGIYVKPKGINVSSPPS